MYARLPASVASRVLQPRNEFLTDDQTWRLGAVSALSDQTCGRACPAMPVHRLRGCGRSHLLRRADSGDLELVCVAPRGGLRAASDRARPAPGRLIGRTTR